MRIGNKLQLTLAILKPDIVARPDFMNHIKDIILEKGFYFIRSKTLRLTSQQAKEFYKEHEGKFFHNRLVTYMTSGPIAVNILARENAIQEWRKLMGPTKVFKAIYEEPDSIRGRYGLTDTRNSTHGSDSPETAIRETKLFFPGFEWEVWYDQEEQYFRNGHVVFDSSLGVHTLCKIPDIRKSNSLLHRYSQKDAQM